MLLVGLEILKIFEENGYQAYFVGGFVRDELMQIPSNDIDITTSATPDEVMRLFKTKPIGIKYGSVLVLYKGYKFEVTTFRSDDKYQDNRHPDVITYSKDIKEDLRRRDFTINAITKDLKGNYFDLFDGKNDIKNQVIKAIGDPLERFNEDAIRILRAYGFVSKLGFMIEDKTKQAIMKTNFLIKNLSFERVYQEMNKIIQGKYVLKAINTLLSLETHKYLIGLEKGLFCLKMPVSVDVFYGFCFALNKEIPLFWHFSKKIQLKYQKCVDFFKTNCKLTPYQIYYFGYDFSNYLNDVGKLFNDYQEVPIKTIYDLLPIHKRSDLDLDFNEIHLFKNNRNSLSKILIDLEKAIINGEVLNQKKDILFYLKKGGYSLLAYLDDFRLITLLTKEEGPFYLDGEKLSIIRKFIYLDMYKYECSTDKDVSLNEDHFVNDAYLMIGRVTRSHLFDKKYFCDETLGVIYSKKGSYFRLYAPTAKEVILLLDGKQNLKYIDKGLWEIWIPGDLNGKKYKYLVRINQEYQETFDPYGKLVKDHFNYIYQDDYHFIYAKPKKVKCPIIYETHIRDFTINTKAINKGKYLGFTEDLMINQVKIGINHVVDLGITHIQLLPIIMFGGIDDKQYNWGYNPMHFFANSEYYELNDRILELKQMIDYLHQKGLRVVLDMVYNHVYEMDKFPYEILIPGYSFRYNKEGFKTEVSGCKNDLATERLMISKMILDSLKYFYKEFNVDGFRFDLMGLLDLDLMQEIRSFFPEDVLIYGEGWNMESTLPKELRANMENFEKIPDIMMFNDLFRNTLRGDNYGSIDGYLFGKDICLYEILNGSSKTFVNPINYVECHDNLTLYDKMLSLNLKDKNIVLLALAITILSKGIPFIHAGGEFLRSKKGLDNTYNSSDEVNQIDWNLCVQNQDLIRGLKYLINIKQQLEYFRFNYLKLNSLIKLEIDYYIFYFKNNHESVKYDNYEFKKIGVYENKEGKIWNLMDM